MPDPVAENTNCTSKRQSFYLFDDDQSADLESLRMAIQGLSAFAELVEEVELENAKNHHQPVITLPYMRHLHFSALLDQLGKRLGDIIGPGSVGSAWLGPEQVWPAERPQTTPV